MFGRRDKKRENNEEDLRKKLRQLQRKREYLLKEYK